MDEFNVLDFGFFECMNIFLVNVEVFGFFEGDEYVVFMIVCKEGL